MAMTLNTAVAQAERNTNEGNQYLTPTEISVEFRLGRSTVNRWIRSGRLPHIKLGPRSVRIRRDHLEAMIQNTMAEEKRNAA